MNLNDKNIKTWQLAFLYLSVSLVAISIFIHFVLPEYQEKLAPIIFIAAASMSIMVPNAVCFGMPILLKVIMILFFSMFSAYLIHEAFVSIIEQKLSVMAVFFYNNLFELI